MRVGKLAGLQTTTTGWELLYTVEKGDSGVVIVTLAKTSAAAATVEVAHVKQGNGGTISRTVDDQIYTPFPMTTETVLFELGVDSLDDVWIKSSVADELTGSVTSHGTFKQR